MRVLVCGGRNYADRRFLESTLDMLQREWQPFSLLIHGGARGADTLAGEWAERNGVAFREFKADWYNLSAPGAAIRTDRNGRKYNARAGHDRNWRMLRDGTPDQVLAFPGGPGTSNMVKLAEAAGVNVIRCGWPRK